MHREKRDEWATKADLEALGTEFGQRLTTEIGSVRKDIHDLIEIIQGFATHTDEQFSAMNKRLTRVEATIVTKEYLDDKIAGLHVQLAQRYKLA